MMKKFGICLFALSLTTVAVAQNEAGERSAFFSRLAEKNILNHMDVGVNVGTVGIGIDVAVPVGDYVRIRTGYEYMPGIKFTSDFKIETRGGSIGKFIDKMKTIDVDKKMEEVGVDLSQPKFKKYKDLFDKFHDVELKDQVTMGMKPNVHQFKFLVDVLPFKNNKHWSFTAGFFAGSSNVGNADNLDKETLLLEGVNAYNDLYVMYCQDGIAGNYHEKLDELFYKNGVAGIPLGYFDDGDKAIMVPAANGVAHAEMRVGKVRPYLGFGYNTHLSKDKRWNLNVDAGVLFLCGKSHVYVDNVYKIDESKIDIDNYVFDILRPNADWTDYVVDKPLQQVDLLHDVEDIPGKVGDMVHKVKNFKVYPNASVTFSYRLF